MRAHGCDSLSSSHTLFIVEITDLFAIIIQGMSCHDLVQAKGWTIIAEYQEVGIPDVHNPTFERKDIRQMIDPALYK